MREMKDSGIKWIGNIPSSWTLSQTRRLFRNEKEIVGDKVDDYERLALTLNGVVKRSKEDSEGLQPEKFESYQILRPNELVFKMIDLENVNTSRVGLSPYTGLVSPAYIILKNDNEDNRYAYYWFMFMYYNHVFNHLGGDGVRSSLSAADMLSLPIPFISLNEQKRISNYLDLACSRIDTNIFRQEQIIEKIQELKLSIITESVTKGTVPGSDTIDSGIPIIGDIPKNWSVVRLKFLLNGLVDCPHETPNYSDDGEYHVIRTADQNIASLRSDCKMLRLNSEEYSKRIRRCSLDAGDIVYGREGGRWGLACLIPESNKYCLGQRMLQFRCNTSVFDPEFAVLALSSRTVYMQGVIDTLGSASPHVNISTVQNYWIVLPPLNEQKRIAKQVRETLIALDKQIDCINKYIDRLQEYKNALIYEVVTGKKEV